MKKVALITGAQSFFAVAAKFLESAVKSSRSIPKDWLMPRGLNDLGDKHLVLRIALAVAGEVAEVTAGDDARLTEWSSLSAQLRSEGIV